MKQPDIFARVIKPYAAHYPDPIIAAKGDRLTLVNWDPEWGFEWAVHTVSGKQGWVPPGYFIRDGRSAIMRTDYSAVELSAGMGERLSLLRFVLGWYWAENAQGKIGWIPRENVHLTEGDVKALMEEAQKWQ